MINNKQELVNSIFSDISSKYDIMNDLMSFGVHRYWKKKFIENIKNFDEPILDVACGSGDIIVEIIKASRNFSANITGVDINEDMLKLAKDRLINGNILTPIKLVQANAEELLFANEMFSYYTTAFGIRNVQNVDLALQEAYRVLKKGGKFLCLEFSKTSTPGLNQIYKYYLDYCIPSLGAIVTDNRSAYEYLSSSIQNFPIPETFSNMISNAGFSNVRFDTMTFGIVAVHVGEKL